MASQGSPVTAIARYSNHLDLFTIGTDNKIYTAWWDESSGWHGWINLSNGVGQPGGQVAAVARYANQIDLFTVVSNGLVYTTWWNSATGWASGWYALGVT